MKCSTFDGGLNIRQAPHLISANQAVTYTNVDNSKGHLIPVMDKVDVTEELDLHTPIKDYAFYLDTVGQAYFTDEPHDWVVYKEILYTSDRVTRPQKRVNSTTFANMGITAPVGTPIFTANGSLLTGIVSYAFTYYNSADGSESNPILSGDYTIATGGYTITVIPQSPDIQVTHTRIYRIGGALTEFTRVTQIADGVTTFNDNITDANVSGELLTTANNAPAPAGLKYLVEFNAMLFGMIGDKLRFTPIGQPENWREDFYLDLPNEGTGIGKTPIGLLVFTLSKTILVTGTGPDTLAQQTISEDQGCISHDSIANTKGRAMWLSQDGVAASNGNVPEVISKNRLGKQVYSVTNALVYNEAYHAHLTDGQILVVDLAYADGIIKMLDYGDTVSLVRVNRILYAIGDGKVYNLTIGTDYTVFDYKSGWLFEHDLAHSKAHDRVRITYSGYIEFDLYINRVLALALVLNSSKVLDVVEKKFSTEFTRGNFVEFAIRGTGQLFEIDFLEASANG